MTGLSIEIRRKNFPADDGTEETAVLADVALEIDAGSFLAILGPSGCGKTTLLNIVAGLDGAFDGRIHWDTSANGGFANIGYVFQKPTLLPWRKVGENLRLVMTPDQIDRQMDRVWLEAMGLGAYADRYPKDLSVGMSRRVSLARAFAVEPDLLLMDEPFVSLDEETAQDLRNLLLETLKRKPTTVLFVTHDSREALQLAQRVVLLSGSPARVIHDQTIALTAEERADSRKIDSLRSELKRVGCGF
jgi:ABC-type nitrate/sulfonate/bicarbonate transport system ATPase subunit